MIIVVMIIETAFVPRCKQWRYESSLVKSWGEGQEEARTTKEEVEDASGEGLSRSVSLEKEDAMNRARWRVGVGEIAVRVG